MTARLIFSLAILAQQPSGAGRELETTPSKSAAVSPWQAYFRQIAGEYRITAGNEDRPLTLVGEPLLKWSQPVRGGDDGAVFLWLQDGRPALIATFFIWPERNGRYGLTHEMHALTGDKVAADWREKVRWRPMGSAVTWQRIPDAPPPSETQSKRLIEARQLARRFAATSRNKEGQSWELRLQPRPFFEYESSDEKTEWIGGALFSIVQGTDTEVILWLEAQRSGSASQWRFACARMSDLELRVTLDEKEVFTTEFSRYDDLSGPYLGMAPEFLREPPLAAGDKRK
jgi:hypothetical protein